EDDADDVMGEGVDLCFHVGREMALEHVVAGDAIPPQEAQRLLVNGLVAADLPATVLVGPGRSGHAVQVRHGAVVQDDALDAVRVVDDVPVLALRLGLHHRVKAVQLAVEVGNSGHGSLFQFIPGYGSSAPYRLKRQSTCPLYAMVPSTSAYRSGSYALRSSRVVMGRSVLSGAGT